MQKTPAQSSFTTTGRIAVWAREGRTGSAGTRASAAKKGRKPVRRTGAKPGRKPVRRTGAKPGRKPVRRIVQKRATESSKPLKMSEAVAYATKARAAIDKMREPWKVERKGGRRPYPPKVLVLTRALKDKFGPRYAPNEKALGSNKRLLAAMRTKTLPSRTTMEGVRKRIPDAYYKKLQKRAA